MILFIFNLLNLYNKNILHVEINHVWEVGFKTDIIQCCIQFVCVGKATCLFQVNEYLHFNFSVSGGEGEFLVGDDFNTKVKYGVDIVARQLNFSVETDLDMDMYFFSVGIAYIDMNVSIY